MQQGYIKLFRQFLEWEWYSDVNTSRLFIHLLLTVNYEDKKWHGMTIKRGQIVTSRGELSRKTKLSNQQIRTAINHLISTNDITKQTTSKFTVISVNNYEKWQGINQQNADVLTNEQPADNQQLTTTKEVKKYKKDKNKEKIYKKENLLFLKFWACYPKKKSKDAALKAFEKINPDEALLSRIINAVEQQKNSADWKKSDGQFIPYPATWLNGKRWEDEIEVKTDGKDGGLDSGEYEQYNNYI